MSPTRSDILQAVARGWCHGSNRYKTMDSTLAEAIADEVFKALSPPSAAAAPSFDYEQFNRLAEAKDAAAQPKAPSPSERPEPPLVNDVSKAAAIAVAALDAAIYVTTSPHEWVWSHDQQVAMAKYCVHAAQVLAYAKNALNAILETEGDDAGVIYLSHESTTHRENGVETYDHEFFSPLGDALVALYRGITTPDVQLTQPVEPCCGWTNGCRQRQTPPPPPQPRSNPMSVTPETPEQAIETLLRYHDSISVANPCGGTHCKFLVAIETLRAHLAPQPMESAPRDGTWHHVFDGYSERWLYARWSKELRSWSDGEDKIKAQCWLPQPPLPAAPPPAAETREGG